MIITSLVQFIFFVLSALMKLIQLPATPLAVVQAVNNSIAFISIPMGIVRTFVGDTFLTGVFVAIVAYVIASPTIHGGIWVYQRIKS